MPESDPNAGEGEEPKHIKDLRDKASTGAAALDENANLKKEMAFMRAGIDTSSKPAQAMIQGYSGELTADAIKAEAVDWNLGPAATPPEGDGTEPVNQYDANSPEFQHQQAAQQAGGTPAPIPDAPIRDGHEQALDDFKKHRTDGMSMKDATTVAFGDVIRAGLEGRPGARFDANDWAAKQAAAGHGAEFAG